MKSIDRQDGSVRLGRQFPDTLVFNGYAAPVRLEGDAFDLEVIGDIPAELDGCYIRNSADHQFPPLNDNDLFLNGDGMLASSQHPRWARGFAHPVRSDREVQARAKRAPRVVRRLPQHVHG